MPKRNADEIVSPPPLRKTRSTTSPVVTKMPKILDEGEEAVTSTASKTVEKKRKRSSADETVENAKKKNENKSSRESLSSSPCVELDNTETQPREEVQKVVLNRNDPVGLMDIRSKLFAMLDTMPDDADAAHVKSIRALSDRIADDDLVTRKNTMDTLFREYLMDEILLNNKSWDGILKLSIKSSQDGIVSASLPIALLVDLIDLTGLVECEAIFKFVEDRLSLWREDHFFNSCKNAVLRMCNDMLRRLSQIQNTILCGRILIFLSNYFPFSERSGLNVMSEFNSDNVTLYKTGDGSDDTEDKMEIADEHEEKLFEGVKIQIPGLESMIAHCQELKKKNLMVDYNMYIKFWTLQDLLRNPAQCYNKVNWKTLTLYTGDMLEAFKSSKLLPEPEGTCESNTDQETDPVAGTTISASQPTSPLFSPTSTFAIPKVGDENIYFAKYLTNRRVLELEMSDPGFRRSFLVQLLIVLQYFNLPVKFKNDSHALNEEQLDFIKKTTDTIYSILLDIKPGGKGFVESVKHVLKREEIWNKWKNDGCPAIKKPVPPVSVTTDPKVDKGGKLDSVKAGGTNTGGAEESIEFDEASRPVVKERPRVGTLLRNAAARKKFTLGNAELNRLWNICPNNLEACRSKARDFMPTLDSYFGEAMKELDPEPVTVYDPKKEVKPKKILGNANFGWRGLRLMARKSPYFFQMVSGTPIHPLQSYLEFVLKKIVADMESSNGTTSEDAAKSKVHVTSGSPGGTSNGVASNAPDEAEMVTATEDDDEELTRPEPVDEAKDEEEGEVRNDMRHLTEEEQTKLGKALGTDWKKLALKLGFTSDEVDYFATEQKANAASYMLKRWTEIDGDEATVAELLYKLEGLELQTKAAGIISV